MIINFRKELNEVLNSLHIVQTEKYKSTIDKIDSIGLTSNSQIMYNLNKALFCNKQLLAKKLLQHSIYEEFGGKIIEDFSKKFATGVLQKDLILQAKDEFKHARMLETLSNFVFKNFEDIENVSIENEEELPEFNNDPKVFVCFIHAAEIRTLIMLNQYIDIVKRMKDPLLNKMLLVFESIKKDEKQHAAYTGKYINEWMAAGEDLENTLLHTFLYTNKESLKEMSVLSLQFSEVNSIVT